MEGHFVNLLQESGSMKEAREIWTYTESRHLLAFDPNFNILYIERNLGKIKMLNALETNKNLHSGNLPNDWCQLFVYI